MDKVAIVILNYNGKHFLQKFLPSVIEFSGNHNIIVADNASTDDSLEFLKTFPAVRTIQLDKNYGFSNGYNIALEQVEAEYYILLNSDVEVSQDWVNPVIDLIETDPEIAACQPKIRSYANKNSFEYAGAAGGFIDKWGYPFCRGRLFNTTEEDHGQYDDNIEIFWATGACLFIKSEAFWKVGGFDKDFFAHMEEIDLCWRLKSNNYKIFYCSKSVVFHVGGGTLSKYNPKKTYLNFRNGLFMLYKNLSSEKLISVIFVRLILDTLTIIKFLLSLAFRSAYEIVHAHISFYKNLKVLKTKREKNVIKKNYRQFTGVYNKGVFIDYFLLGKKKFSDLF